MKNPAIYKNSTDAIFATPVSKLRTREVGGGSVDWVPDDETKADKIKVTQNGE